MAIILLVNGGPETVSISLEDVPLVMSRFRLELRGLERELRAKWPVVSVGVEQPPRVMRNPHFPGTPIPPSPPLLLVVAYTSYKAGRMAEKLSRTKSSFMQSASTAAGKEIGKDIGRKIRQFVNKWLQQRLAAQSTRKDSKRLSKKK